jgi:hypothetical protein
MTASNISVTQPVGQAIERVKRLLFQPFDPARWFVIGFCAWLAYLGQTGFHGGYNYQTGRSKSGTSSGLGQALEQAWHYVLQNLWWIVPVAVAIAVLAVAIWLLVLWLSSRGHFMFLHCVALNMVEVQVPWQKFVREGNSLFVFRLVLGLSAFVVMVPLAAGITYLIWRMADHRALTALGVMGAAGLGIMAMICMIGFAVAAKLTKDFVVPIQFLRGVKCVEAWRMLLSLLSANIGSLIVYLLFQIVLAIAIFTLILMVVVATCCVAGCLLAIPYLGTVLLLPVLIFSRAYSLYYLAQYGNEYKVIVD